MKTIALMVLTCGLMTSLGCVHLQPIGPLTKGMQTGEPASSADSKVKITAPKDAPAGPTMIPAPNPPAPTVLVSPGEVTESNANEAARRLAEELERDQQAMENMPRYSEVSVIKK